MKKKVMKGLPKRITAFVMAILMFFSLMPIDPSVFLAEENSYQFIVKAGDNAIKGATVNIYRTKDEEKVLIATGTTNEEGSVATSVQEGVGALLFTDAIYSTIDKDDTYEIIAYGYKIKTGSIAEEQSYPITVSLELATNSVTGTIVLPDGSNDYSDLNAVELLYEDGTSVKVDDDPVKAEINQENGEFTFSGITPGFKYKIKVTSKNNAYVTESREVDLTDVKNIEDVTNLDEIELTANITLAFSFLEDIYRVSIEGTQLEITPSFGENTPSNEYTINYEFTPVQNENVSIEKNDVTQKLIVSAKEGAVVGDITVTATLTGDTYTTVSDTFVIEIYKAEKDVFSFIAEGIANGEVSQIKYGSDSLDLSAGVDGEVDDSVTYKVDDEDDDPSNDPISVDENGQVTVNSVGSATVVATLPESAVNAETVIRHVVTVIPADQTNEVTFTKTWTPTDGKLSFKFDENENTYDFAATTNEEDATISYKVTDAEGNSITGDVATIGADGKFICQKPGTYIVTATAEKPNYNDKMASYTVVITKKDPGLTFVKPEGYLDNIINGMYLVDTEAPYEFVEQNLSSTNGATIDSNDVTYDVTYDSEYDIEEYGEFVSVGNTAEDKGKVTFSNIKNASAGTVQVTITATWSGDEYYESGSTSYTFQVVDWDPTTDENFKWEDIYDITEPNENGWYSHGDITVTLKDNTNYKLYATVPTKDTVGVDSYQYTGLTDGKENEVSFYLMDVENSYISAIHTIGDIQVDTSAPSIAIKKENDSLKDFFLYFFKGQQEFNVEVTGDNGLAPTNVYYYIADELEATDDEEEIEEKAIQYDDWKLLDGNISIDRDAMQVIYAKVVDDAGNVSYANTNGLITDNIAPVINVDELETINGYLTSDFNIVFDVIEEAELSGIKEVYYMIGSADAEKQYLVQNEVTNDTKYEDLSHEKLDLQIQTINVEDYPNGVNVYIVAEDNAGNKAECTKTYKTCIETPTISVSYDNNDVANGAYYKNNRIATITINSREDVFVSENAIVTVDGNPISVVWDGNQSTTVEFTTDGEHTLLVKYENKVGVKSTDYTDTFWIDTKIPTGTATLVEVEGTIWSDIVEKLTFGIWKKPTVRVKATLGEDENPTVATAVKMHYFVSNQDKIPTENDLGSETWPWQTYTNDTEISLTGENIYAVYFKLEDLAGNVKYISTDGFVIDDTKPGITLSPESPNAAGFYNDDVTVGVSVNDLVNVSNINITSGIKSITYKVTCDGDESQSGTLYTFDKVNPEKNVLDETGEFEGTFIVEVSEEKNNSADVVVTVYVEDNAGNTAESQPCTLNINATAPKVEISYDNNDAKGNGEDGYFFKAGRKAKVVITDRNDTFNPTDATDAIILKNIDGQVVSKVEKGVEVTGWETQGNTHTAYVTFTQDGYYALEIDYMNEADVSNNKEVTCAEGTVAAFEFVIDTEAPINVSISVPIFSKVWNAFLEIITFGLYNVNEDVTLIMSGEDVTSKVTIEYLISDEAKNKEQLDEITTWQAYDAENGLTVTEEQKMSVYVKVTDQAGNVTYINSEGIIIDKTPATITWDVDTNKIYTDDVEVGVSVNDSGVISGVESVKYTITSDGNETDAGILDITGGNILVKASENNSDNVVVTVEVLDKAGNKTEETRKLSINTTAPTVDISYDNNNCLVDNGKYFFKELRTATITITDRADSFDAQAATNAIKVTLSDKAGQEVSENGIVINGWTTKGNVHTATVEFTKDGYYTVEVDYVNKAGLSNGKTVTPESLAVAPFEFVIDTTKPINVSISALSNIWRELLELITFGLYPNENVEFTITGDDVTSNVVMEYYITNDVQTKTSLQLEQIEDDKWTTYTQKETISKEQQMSIYVRVTDQAGNRVYVNSNGIVYDKTPAGIVLTPEAPNKNNSYNSDVEVVITVDDSDITSGIKTVEYWITCDGKETKREVLYTFDKTLPTKEELQSTYQREIIIDAKENNSSNVIVTVEVTDNAGNTSQKSRRLYINSTAPTVDISYDNNDYTGFAGEKYFFDKLRTATITITDRADTFDEEAATNAIKVVLKDKAGQPVEENGIVIDGWETNGNTHTAIVEFTKDGYYTLDVEYTNKADMSNEDVVPVESTEAPFAFVIDTKDPINVSVSALSNIWKQLLEIITFGLYTNKDVELAITGEDVTSDVLMEYYIANDGQAKTETQLEQIEDEYWTTCAQKVTIKKDQQMSVYVRVTDQAGNRVYVNTDGIVLDKTEAGIVMTPDAPNEHGFYNSDVDVAISVDDSSITSGIKTVKYWITSDGEETIRKTLYAFDKTSPTKAELKQTYEDMITVVAEENNSSNVIVTVEVTDNAGNVKQETVKLRINTTVPTVDISYDSNDYTGLAGEKYFFDKLRTATIVITDRPDTFDAEAATKAIKVMLKDKDGQQVAENGIVISNWTTAGNKHTATVAFTKDGYYTLDVEYTNKADMSNTDVMPAESTEAPFAFVIDTTDPIDVSVSALSNIWKELLEIITFGLYTNEDVELTISGEDVTSDIVIEYYIANDGQAKTTSQLEQIADEEWTTYTQKVTISKEQQMAVYVRVTDQAGNRVHVNSDGIVLDKTQAGIVLTPEAPNKNNFYNNDVDVAITVDDSDITSGIKSVKYWITCDGKETERDTLYTFDKTSPTKDELKQTYEGKITVDAEKNNSSKVVVTVEVIDNAGNVKKETTEIAINSTAPTVDISYDNNEYTGLIGSNYFFDELRTATIIITDRADTFDAEAATKAIKVILKDKAGQQAEENGIIISEWTTAGNKHTATVAFTKDGYYTFDVKYTNKADMSNTDVVPEESTEAPFAFVIDITDPINVSISALSNIWKDLLEIVTFGLYTNEDIELTITADDVTSDIVIEYYIANDGEAKTALQLEKIAGEEWTTYTQEFVVNKEQQMSVFVRVTDEAGNRVYINSSGIVLDKTEAGLVITPEEPNSNGIYNSDVDVDIVVDDTEITSGIKLIEYWITCDGEETKREKIFTFNNDTPAKEDLKYLYEGTITVDASENNSSNVVVYVKVEDNAGNVNTKSISLDIDITKPVISVSYDNNTASDIVDGKGYFDNVRKATIIVTERTDHFDKDAFINGVVITANDAKGTDLSSAIPTVTYVGTKEGDTSNDATHTFTVDFTADANYTISIEYTDKAEWKCTDSDIVYSEEIVAPKKFAVDKTVPTGKITIGELGFWEELLHIITFGLWSPSDVDVEIVADDVTSPVKTIEYYKTATFTALTMDELKEVDEWVVKDSFTVDADDIFVVYAKITDQAGNVQYISSNGIIVDESKPVFETFGPEITITSDPTFSGIYNGDVRVDVYVIDPMVGSNLAYAGLKNISYEIYNMGTKTQEGTLFNFTEENPTQDKLVQSWNEQDIIVDAVKNNSNDVVVKVIATDNAGNQSTKELALQIDITKPVIDISYDNNNGDASFVDGTYFNSNRVATIKVTERNFDANAVDVVITNTDGTIPTISDWAMTEGTGNNDDAVHTTTIVYSADGDYTFEISLKDRAGNDNESVNYGDSQAPTEFTIDKVAPIISVGYDNNDFVNGNYYKADRTATISILEHNFDASRVEITITATDNGQPVNIPVIGEWSKLDDTYTVTINYTADALYTFHIAYSDKAQNVASDFEQQSFYVDKTMPQMSITEIVDQSANNQDKIGFVITATDTNFDVFTPVLTAVVKTETGFTTKEIDIASMSDIANGRVYTIYNIDTDGIYRITCTLVDKAGNAYNAITLHQADGTPYVEERTAEDTLLSFSVNRDGSAFEVDENTQEILDNYYVYDVKEDIVIIEVNANQLTSNIVSLNGKELVEGIDYTIATEGGNGLWLRYSYSLNKELFAEEGEYTMVVSSVDEAENNAFSDVKNTKVAFVVDRTAPVVTISGLETNGRYQTEAQEVTLIPTDDGGAVKSIVVNQVDEDNNVIKTLQEELSGEALEEALDANDGQLTFVIPSGEYDYIEIVCTDCSVNESGSTNKVEILIEDVLITENELALIWATYQYAIIGGGAVAVAAPTGVVLFRRRLRFKVK